MKKIIYIILLLPIVFMAQTTTENYVKSTNYKVKTLNGTSKTGTTSALSEEDKQISVSYFDGLGRPKQSIAVRAGGQKQDIITPMLYDEFGRQIKEYLPYSRAYMNQTHGLNYEPNLIPDSQGNILPINNQYLAKYPDDFAGDSLPDINAYSQKVFDNSPLNRVLEQAAPGKDWKVGNGHTIKLEYLSNTSSDNIRLYKVLLQYDQLTKIYQPTIINDGFYLEGELYKTITKDENWLENQAQLTNHTTEEYKNKSGQVLLKRTYTNNGRHDTYYVYDDYGNLTYVISPKGSSKIGSNNGLVSNRILDNLCYQYIYDRRNRLVAKKIPGKKFEYIVYNKIDQPVLTQDAVLAKLNVWLFTKYDVFGRVVYTGKYGSSLKREDLQELADNWTGPVAETRQSFVLNLGNAELSYTSDAFPTSVTTVFTINYYDSYENLNFTQNTNPNTVFNQTVSNKTKGLLVASKTKILEFGNQWIENITYYDDRARVIYSFESNSLLRTVNKVFIKLDFTGKTIKTLTEQDKIGQDLIEIEESFTYDHADRLLTHSHKINEQPIELLVNNNYDELGQLIEKKVGNNIVNPLQIVDYKYNIRGWLTNINDPKNLNTDLFSQSLSYNNITKWANGASSLGIKPLYNGNISESIWKTSVDNLKRGYGFTYDPLNRIKRARSQEGEYFYKNLDFHGVNNINYDRNGNILNLQRSAPNSNYSAREIIDELSYNYKLNGTSNQLVGVEDTSLNLEGFNDGNTISEDYAYDDNGNLKVDKNKGITSITYNFFNLPKKITFTNGNYIKYLYDGNGNKLEKVVSNHNGNTKTLYAGNYIYNLKNNNKAELQFFSHPEGYVQPTNTGNFEYVYQYKDHLGNVRLSYSDTNNDGEITASSDLNTNEILDEKNYYPFGLEHKGYNNVIIGVENNHFTYVGKERNESLGYNMLEMDWRHYDPAIGRFVSIDVYSESYESLTPYHYGQNNPIIYSDPTGLFTDVVNEDDPNQVIHIEDGYDFVFTVSGDDFAEISESGAIPKRLNWAWTKEFFSQLWGSTKTSDGTITGDVTELLTDEVDSALEAIEETSNGNYTSAVLAVFLRKVQKAKKGAKLIKKLFKYGKKSNLPTPTLNADQFKPGSKAGEWIHKKTGAIFSKSKTSHGNTGNIGEQWKAWSKGTKEFGNVSKKAGDRVTIDGAGKVIGN